MKWIYRLLIGAGFAVPIFLLTFAFVRTEALARPAETGKCFDCHSDFYKVWSDGAHGQASTEETFQALWQAQGKPERCLACHTTGYDPTTGEYQDEGVTCAACHGPAPDNHPLEPMPVDRSANTCGTCHVDTMLEWQVSQHRQQNLTCVSCHDSHAGELKADTPSDLCAVCHEAQSSKFSHTDHSQNDVTCVDCHLEPMDSLASEGHAFRNHSFNVELSTCNQCHADRMHEPVAMPMTQPTATAVDAMASVSSMGVSVQPEPVSPLGFALLAALLGFGGGIVLAPQLERWYRSRDREEK